MKRLSFLLLAITITFSSLNSCTPESISEDDTEINAVAIDKDKIEPTTPPKGDDSDDDE